MSSQIHQLHFQALILVNELARGKRLQVAMRVIAIVEYRIQIVIFPKLSTTVPTEMPASMGCVLRDILPVIQRHHLFLLFLLYKAGFVIILIMMPRMDVIADVAFKIQIVKILLNQFMIALLDKSAKMEYVLRNQIKKNK